MEREEVGSGRKAAVGAVEGMIGAGWCSGVERRRRGSDSVGRSALEYLNRLSRCLSTGAGSNSRRTWRGGGEGDRAGGRAGSRGTRK